MERKVSELIKEWTKIVVASFVTKVWVPSLVRPAITKEREK
jgi:hypothetical protein